MYKYFKGKIVEKSINNVVCETGGIGYIINMPVSCVQNMLVEKDYKILVHQAIRETEIELFGFLKEEELFLFKKLISISKIGPKTALNIMSLYVPQEFSKIVEQGDLDALSKVPGIGKKGAGRIILEIKGKINFSELDDDKVIEQGAEFLSNTAEALRSFGYKDDSIRKVLKKVEKEFDENSELEEIIKFALKNIEGN
ncbi:MAG: Holliday junction branch migration protein RuvA [Candidatus Muiribacteriota bacterium]|jgi:Holliday junction DNA helicase RuvA